MNNIYILFRRQLRGSHHHHLRPKTDLHRAVRPHPHFDSTTLSPLTFAAEDQSITGHQQQELPSVTQADQRLSSSTMTASLGLITPGARMFQSEREATAVASGARLWVATRPPRKQKEKKLVPGGCLPPPGSTK